MSISRRDFIKRGMAGAIGGGFMLTQAPSLFRSLALAETLQPAVPQPSAHRFPWRMVVDIRKCIGCGKCARACKMENDVPLEPEYNRTWVERYTVSETDEVFVDSPDGGINGFAAEYIDAKYSNLQIRKSFFVPKLCNQCERPPCVSVCPVGATYATKEGIVLVNRKACIGCRYCVQACPYGARFLDPRLKVVDKCTWCYHRITKGLLPACVEVCPVGARLFGDANDINSPVNKAIRENPVSVLKLELGTEPQVYYIGLEKGVR